MESGHDAVRAEAVHACIGGWGPMWRLAVHRLQAVHGSGSGVLACGEDCIVEVRRRIEDLAAAADAAAAATHAQRAAGVAPAEKVTIAQEHLQAGPDGGGADVGLADTMVALMVRTAEGGGSELLTFDTGDGLQAFVAQCEQVRRRGTACTSASELDGVHAFVPT